MSRQVLFWTRPRATSAPCGVCGESTRDEACAALQSEPHALTRWVPRCYRHTRDGIVPTDTGVELRIRERRIFDGWEKKA